MVNRRTPGGPSTSLRAWRISRDVMIPPSGGQAPKSPARSARLALCGYPRQARRPDRVSFGAAVPDPLHRKSRAAFGMTRNEGFCETHARRVVRNAVGATRCYNAGVMSGRGRVKQQTEEVTDASAQHEQVPDRVVIASATHAVGNHTQRVGQAPDHEPADQAGRNAREEHR